MTKRDCRAINCPFLAQPLPGCRVSRINGDTIPQILEHCGARYAECPLYLNKQAEADVAITP